MLEILPGDKESFDHQIHVQLERLAINLPTHNLNHLLSQLEVCPFESQIACWRYVKNKPEVDMHYVSFLFVDEDIAIVSVLDLQNVGNYRISCLWFYEVLSCFLESAVMLSTKITDEKLIQGLLVSFADGVPRNCFRHDFNNTPNVQAVSSSIRYRFVGK